MNNLINEDNQQIQEVLGRFQEGYTFRNIDNANAFVDELFAPKDEAIVLGTGTGELFLGSERIKELIRDDWNYWGDVKIDYKNAPVSVENDVAWFISQGSVKYSFEDKPERYDSYLEFIKKKMSDQELSSKQKLTFLNWALMLTYHQREDKKREYLWPLCLTGVLRKEEGQWKFTQLHFAIAVSDFPDERFENSKDHLNYFNNQNLIAEGYTNNQITDEHKNYLKALEKELFGQKDSSEEMMEKYFLDFSSSLVVGPNHQEYRDGEQIKKYFSNTAGSKLTLASAYAIATTRKGVTWITTTGTIEQEADEDTQLEQTVSKINDLLESENTSREKIFMVQRSIAYHLKEGSVGEHFTYPVRLSAVLVDYEGQPVIKMLHISYPSYWIFEEKVNASKE